MVFLTMSIITGISNGISKVAMPLFAAALNAAPWEIGLVGGLQFAGPILLSLPVGAMVDRHGGRPSFLFGCAAAFVFYLFGFPQMFASWHLIVGVFLMGLINPFRMVPTQAEFLHQLPRLGLFKAGWQRAAHTMGLFFIGPFLGAILISTVGYPNTFRLVAVGFLVVLLVGGRVFKTTPAPRSHEATSFSQRIKSQLSLVANRPNLRRTMAIEFAGQMAMSYFTVFIMLVGMRAFQMGTETAATLVSLNGGIFVFTLLVGGFFVRGIKPPLIYALAFALAGFAQLLIGCGYSPIMLWIAAALMGIGHGLQHLTSVSLFATLAHEFGRGRISGLTSISGPMGSLTGAIGGGLVVQNFGLLAGFRVLSLLYIFLCMTMIVTSAFQWAGFPFGKKWRILQREKQGIQAEN